MRESQIVLQIVFSPASRAWGGTLLWLYIIGMSPSRPPVHYVSPRGDLAMSDAKRFYQAYLRRLLPERGYARDRLESAVERALLDPTSLAPRYYDYFDQRWVICDQPHLSSVLRLRLGHGVDVINTVLVLVLAF
jgi:hypothetical protein